MLNGAGSTYHIIPGTVVRTKFRNRTIKFFVENRDDIIQGCHFSGKFYEQEELDIIEKYFKEGGVFVDVGANVGNHTLYAAKMLQAERVIPFEVNPAAIEILLLNLALNDCSNVIKSYLGWGVSSEDGNIVKSVDDCVNNLGGQSFRKLDRNPGHSDGFAAIGLDAVLSGTPVDLIKIDIEGMEMQALAGLQETVSRWRPHIFAEVEDCNLKYFEIWLNERSYTIVDKFGRYPGKCNYMAAPV